jgi:hypothetical protein
MRKKVVLILLTGLFFTTLNAQKVYFTQNGKVSFVSDAPLELIKASSNELNGAIDMSNNRFAFKIDIRSLKGFNSALQQVHFYENYMETDLYKSSSFRGKIIEKIDVNSKEVQNVRAKGILTIHGVELAMIINAKIKINDEAIEISSEFDVMLEDLNIRIPTIVYQKIAESINIEVRANLLPQKQTD